MLVLSLSNKVHVAGDASSDVTGKFGLGFKSTYLITDCPQILSGRLAFEITGAMYPRRLIGDERRLLDDCRAKFLAGNTQATILRLPLTDVAASDVLFDFLRLAHILVVFARQIRSCVVNGGEAEVRWQPQTISSVPHCYTGSLDSLGPSDSVTAKHPKRAFLITSEHESVLFTVGARQFEAFPGDVPTIWVTAPTQEMLDVGFLVNGPFALDVGRAQLARDVDQNRELSSRLGSALANQLCAIFQVTKSPVEWGAFRAELRLAADANIHDFWDSLFQLLGNALAARATQDGPADALIREAFWNNSDRAAAKLYSTCQALPSRMSGTYKRLVSLPEVRYAVKGLLADDESVFTEMASWNSFRENAPPGTVVSFVRVLQPLLQLATAMVSHVRLLSASTVLEWEFKYGTYADPPTAKRLGIALTKHSLELVADRVESRELRTLLDTVEFKGGDNQYYSAKQLLLGHIGDPEREDRHDDERLRAQFAPISRVLSEDYQGPAIAFFDVCREKLDADSRQMADWIVEATDTHKRLAALNYLAHGQLANGLIAELQRRGFQGTWLADLASSDVFHALDEASKARLLELLPKSARPEIDWDSLRQDHNVEPLDPETVLVAVHTWWRDNRHQPQDQFDGRSYLQEYERRTYPNGQPAHLSHDEKSHDLMRRKDWTTVLLLGLMHTMGRAQPGQHRHFLQNCDQQGWLDMFAASEQDANRWMGFVRSYLEQQVDEAEYFQWMKQFVGIFQVSRYLDEYVELFLAIDRIERPFLLTEITQPLTSSLFQGGGIAAPPISRVLGLGACFVVRELVRLGILSNDLAQRHCYVPTKRVRDLFELLGCDGLDLQTERWNASIRIHSFVTQHIGPESATFSGNFDIPFQFIAEVESLQQRFFQQRVDDHEDDLLDRERGLVL